MPDTGIAVDPIDSLFTNQADETPEVETEVPETTEEEIVETGDETPAEAETEATEEAETSEEDKTEQPVETDGRMLPHKLKAYLKELQAKDNNLAKEIRASWIAAKEFNKIFPTVKDAVHVKETLDQWGGEEGLQQFGRLKTEWDAVDKQIADGDPKILDLITPEAMAKIGPAAIDKFIQADLKGYQRVFTSHLVSMFGERDGLIDKLQDISRALEYGETDKITKTVEAISQWINKLDQFAKTKPTQQQVDDPERKKLEAEKQQFHSQKLQMFNNSVVTRFDAFKKDSIGKQLDSYFKGAKLDAEQRTILEDNIMAEVTRVLKQDPKYWTQLEQLRNNFDEEGFTKFLQSRTGKLIPDATKKIYNTFYKNTAPQKAAPKPPVKAGEKEKVTPIKAGHGFIKVDRQPSSKEINASHSQYFEMLMRNQAVLKNGKRVQWD